MNQKAHNFREAPKMGYGRILRFNDANYIQWIWAFQFPYLTLVLSFEIYI